jgi:hypothetical protein
MSASYPAPQHAPLAPFRLLYQEPRTPPPGQCPMMQSETFNRLDEAERRALAMQTDHARRPVQILDANRRVIWDDFDGHP